MKQTFNLLESRLNKLIFSNIIFKGTKQSIKIASHNFIEISFQN